MNTVKKAFEADNNPLDNTYYLFVVTATDQNTKTGYMPFQQHYGFVFIKAPEQDQQNSPTTLANFSHTLAHELGHGAFNLRHTFSPQCRYPLAERTTDNLMDYNNGTALFQYQWDLIDDPNAGLYWFLSEEEMAEVDLYNAINTNLFMFVPKNKLTFGIRLDMLLDIDALGPITAPQSDFDEAMALVQTFKDTPNTPQFFINIPKDRFVEQLMKRIEQPKYTEQQYFGCGPAATCYLYTTIDPIGYTTTVINLYKEGKSTIYNRWIDTKKEIYACSDMKEIEEKLLLDEYLINKTYAVDYILQGSLRCASSFFLKKIHFTFTTNTIQNRTFPNKIDDWLKGFGMKIIEKEIYPFRTSKSFEGNWDKYVTDNVTFLIPNINKYLLEPNKYWVVAFVNSMALEDPCTTREPEFTVGSHYIVVEELTNVEYDTNLESLSFLPCFHFPIIKMQRWDYGSSSYMKYGEGQLSYSPHSQFIDLFKGYWIVTYQYNH